MYFRKEFIILFILFYALNSTMLAVGISEGIKADVQVANQTVTEIRQLRQVVTELSIFTHNLRLALISAIPVAGIIFCMFVSYNTGMVYGHMGRFYGLTELRTMAIAFTSFIGIIEFIAICTLVAESTLLVYLSVRNFDEAKRRLKTQTPKSLLLTVVLLAVGAIIEMMLIRR